MNYNQYIEENTLRFEASRRGGGIEIDCSEILELEDEDETPLMSAYQNYLGGGLLGSIQSSKNFTTYLTTQPEKIQTAVAELEEALKRYFHKITNEEASDYDEWNETAYEALQQRSASAY